MVNPWWWRPIEPTPNPHGATISSLNGVVCTSVPLCTAVGESKSAGTVTLIERYS
jgi:hypothetical protein